MEQFTCARCNKPGSRLPAPPLPGDLGNRIYDAICQNCWQEWLKHQTALINHYGLNLMDPEARTFLKQQTEAYLFAPPEN